MCWFSFATCQGGVRAGIVSDINYFYEGDPQLLKEMLLSIPDHISNCHQFPDNKKYKGCPHPPLVGEPTKELIPFGCLVSKFR